MNSMEATLVQITKTFQTLLLKIFDACTTEHGIQYIFDDQVLNIYQVICSQ
jgi:hypothetical protein